MQTIPIESAAPGYQLAKAVYAKDGRIILPVGQILTQEALATLKKMQIAQIVVKKETMQGAPSPAKATPSDMMVMVKKIVQQRFMLLDINDPYIRTLYDLAIEHQSRLLLRTQGAAQISQKKTTPAFNTHKPEPTTIEALVEASHKIGTLPVVFHQLVEVINNPYSSAADAANVIATDPALSAKLLRLVNSPAYGLPTRIDTISRAVSLIGTGQLVILAMGATLVTAFKGVPVSLINMQTFWDHSITCGITAKILAKRVKQPNSESFFVSGLLHDIARLVIYTQLPAHALYLLTEAKKQNVLMHTLEKEALGFTHEQLGAALLKVWRCPGELIQRVQLHHAPLPDNVTADLAIIPIANLLTLLLGYGSSGEVYGQPINPVAWEVLQITPDQLSDLCINIEEHVREMRAFFTQEY